MVASLTVDDSQINNLSQVNISVIQYFEFQLKLLGPLQQPKSEVKFFTSVWKCLLSCFFGRKGLSCSKYVLSDYLTEANILNLFLKAETWVFRSRSK